MSRYSICLSNRCRDTAGYLCQGIVYALVTDVEIDTAGYLCQGIVYALVTDVEIQQAIYVKV